MVSCEEHVLVFSAAVSVASLFSSFQNVHAGVLCEVVNPEDGSMSRTPELLEFAKQHRLRCITIADLVRYRLRYDVYGKELPATQAQ